MIKNALCIDLDDLDESFYETFGIRYKKYCIDNEVLKLLDHLNLLKIKATFFVPGAFIRKSKKLLIEIDKRRHDIAANGLKHRYIYKLTKREFENDVKTIKKEIEDVVGKRVDTYKAPIWSVSEGSLWQFDKLIEAGYKIDNSVKPKLIRNFKENKEKDTRINNYDCEPFIYKKELLIIPPTFLNIMNFKIIFCGGFYNAWVPNIVERYFFKKINNKNIPFNYYFHPFEHSPCRFIERGVSYFSRVYLYSLHSGIYRKKLQKLSKYFELTTLKNAYKNYLKNEKTEKYRIVILSIDNSIYYGRLYKKILKCHSEKIYAVVKVAYFRKKNKNSNKLLNLFSEIKYRLFFYRIKGFLYIVFRYLIMKIAEKGNFLKEAEKKSIKTCKINSLSEYENLFKDEKIDFVICSIDEKIPKNLLKTANKGWVNIHCGILPKYAGVDAPFWAILNEEKEFGVTLHLMDEEFDSGDILMQEKIYGAYKVYFKLVNQLFEKAFYMLSEFLENPDKYMNNKVKQDMSRRNYYKKPKIKDSIEFFKRGNRFV